MNTDRVRLISHTVVNSAGQRIAGFLVRVRATGKDIGRVWFERFGWRWSTNDAARVGGGESADVAATALFEANVLDLRDREPMLDWAPRHPSPGPVWTSTPRTTSPPRASVPRPVAAKPRPHKPSIVWDDDAPDLTASITAALARHHR